MIRFDMTCENGHDHDSWFASNAAFDGLRAAGQLQCPVCGSPRVDKALMAPAVATTAQAERTPERTPERITDRPAVSDALAERLATWRRHVEATSDYVGLEFATEARAIHEGTAPERPIWGEARLDEARKLLDEGIAVAPLPFVPRSKTN